MLQLLLGNKLCHKYQIINWWLKISGLNIGACLSSLSSWRTQRDCILTLKVLRCALDNETWLGVTYVTYRRKHWQPILIIHRLRMCKLTNLLVCVCSSKSSPHSTLAIAGRHVHGESTEQCEPLGAMLPAEVQQSGALPARFSSHTVKRCPFWNLGSAMFSAFLVLLVGDLAL